MHLQPPPFPPILLRHWLKIRSMKRKQLNPKLLTCHTPHIHPRKIFKNSNFKTSPSRYDELIRVFEIYSE